MSLEDIMARAEAAAQNKKEQDQNLSVEKELVVHEQTQEQLAEKQARLEEVIKQKGIDQEKLQEIRDFLGTSSGYAKGKREIKSGLQEAGLSQDQIDPFLDEARAEQRPIVDQKLAKRQQRSELKAGLDNLSSEENELTQEIQNTKAPELSESAQAEVNRRDQLQMVADLVKLGKDYNEIKSLKSEINLIVQNLASNAYSGKETAGLGQFKRDFEILEKHPQVADDIKEAILQSGSHRVSGGNNITGKDLLRMNVYPPESYTKNTDGAVDKSDAIALGDYLDRVAQSPNRGESEEELKGKIDSLVQTIPAEEQSAIRSKVINMNSGEDEQAVSQEILKVLNKE